MLQPCCGLSAGELFLVKGVRTLDTSEKNADSVEMQRFLEEVMCENCRVRYARLLSNPDMLLRTLELAA